MLLPRLCGGDSPIPAEVGEPRVVSGPATTPVFENTTAAILPINPSPAAGAIESVPTKSSSKVRRAVLASFPYDPSARKNLPEETSPILVRAQPASVDADVVVMRQMEVTASAYERNLPAAMANWRDPRPQNTSRFGTGLHQKDLGKVRASVVTILYVPIFFGLSW